MQQTCPFCGATHDDSVACALTRSPCTFCAGTGLVLDEGHTYEMAPEGKISCPACLGSGVVNKPKPDPGGFTRHGAP